MKRTIFLFAIISMMIGFTSTAYSFNPPSYNRSLIADNLIRGIETGNAGMKESAALRIFEFIEQGVLDKNALQEAVIPLMKLLRIDNPESVKIAAALALFKLEDGRGIYLLGGTAKFDSSAKVRKVGKNLYLQFHNSNGTTYLADL